MKRLKHLQTSILLATLCVFSGFNNMTSAQNVNIPDTNFKAALVGDLSINTNADAEIQVSEAAAFTGTLDVSTMSITDLTGIEAFTALTVLKCGFNQITSLDVSANTVLTQIDCYGNQLTSLVVSANTALTQLLCAENDLTNLDVSANTALTKLDCAFNQITSLDVSANTALTQLYCSNNQLTTLDVSANTDLTQLDCNNTQLTSLDVSANSALTNLQCGDNLLTSLDVSANTALTQLNCYNNQLTSLDVSANIAISTLNCSGNSLTSLDVSANTNLTLLECGYNQLTSLDVFANSALTILRCSYSQLTSLDVSANTALTQLFCDSTQLTSLDVSINTALTDLNCNSNTLTSLDVSANTALANLDCSSNQLTSLDLSANTSLTNLRCDGNQLTSLVVSANTALTGLHCDYNQLTSLDVSANTALAGLYCNGNQLTSLNVSANPALNELKCNNNQLTSLDVSANPALSEFSCRNNQLMSLNVQNGNNIHFEDFYTYNNLNLECIKVDDVAFSTANWLFIDPWTSFNTLCPVRTSVIKGRIYEDKNTNCIFDGSDNGLSKWGHINWIVKASKSGVNYFSFPDTNGFYVLKVDTGNFIVTLINPIQLYSVACPFSQSYPVTISTNNDTINNIDFAVQTQIACSMLRTSINAGLFRPCVNTLLTIDYCNEGTQTENSAQLNFTIPTELNVLNSSIPWDSVSGNTYFYNIGLIPPGICETITVNANVLCNPAAMMNTTLCILSEISPAQFCISRDTLWDKSSVKVIGTCRGDTSVCFTIQNNGSPVNGNMQGSSQWRLYADNLLVQQGTFQLQGGQDTVLCFPANGQTLRLEADQRPRHPGHSRPRASVERCGILTGGQTYSLGQILSVPADNSLPFSYQYCGLVLTSFDPNDKSVVPEGITNNHFISTDDRLEYKINFQNTGNDTAFGVIVKDTLDLSVLDISTLVLGSSSHANNFTVEGSGILVWKFQNINLPDSNINEPFSHGYVSFSINQLPGFTMSRQVLNKAEIYFDYNPPVSTNAVINTICVSSQPIISFNGNQLESTQGLSYRWFLDGVLIPGAISQTYAPLSLGLYSVEVIDTIGCTSLSNPFNLITLSIQGVFSSSLSATLYPNPTSNKTLLKIKPNANGQIQVALIGITGEDQKVLYEIKVEQNQPFQLPIATESLVAGVYIVRLTLGKERSYLRLLVIK